MRKAPWIFLLLLGCATAFGADPLPPKPARYVEDSAGLLSAQTRDAINAKLEAFERETSSQVVVAIFPKVPADYAMEDFTQRTAEAWGVGQKQTDNGAVFFVFPQDHKMRVEVGYGLEGAIPDATAKTILDREVTPKFRAGDFNGGVTRGVDAILAAARGEYKGTGRTNADNDGTNSRYRGDYEPGPGATILLIFFGILFVFLIASMAGQTAWYYSGNGRKRRKSPWWISGGGSGWGGGGFGGGSGGGGFGGGGGFSGGGGSFGGGGASGGW